MVKLLTYHTREVARITDQHLLCRKGRKKHQTARRIFSNPLVLVTMERINSHCNVLCRDIKMVVPSRNMNKREEQDADGWTNSALGISHLRIKPS